MIYDEKDQTFWNYIYDSEYKKFFLWSGTMDYLDSSDKWPDFILSTMYFFDDFIRWIKSPRYSKGVTKFEISSETFILRSLYDEECDETDLLVTKADYKEFYSIRDLADYLRCSVRSCEHNFPVKERSLSSLCSIYGFEIYRVVKFDERADV